MSTVVYVGSAVDYAVYVECGTGKYSTVGGGTHKESWVYRDEFGNYHMAHPMKARPYLKPAVADHANEYMNLLKSSLENA